MNANAAVMLAAFGILVVAAGRRREHTRVVQGFRGTARNLLDVGRCSCLRLGSPGSCGS
jgi:hypothetical protein